MGWAASLGQLEAVKTLILLGADPFVQDEAGFTPLNDAIREKHQPVVNFLMSYHKKVGREIPEDAFEMSKREDEDDELSNHDQIISHLNK
ncbi:MAG: ankyrin repeat domain-containing protein [Desulfobacterales bacterium]